VQRLRKRITVELIFANEQFVDFFEMTFSSSCLGKLRLGKMSSQGDEEAVVLEEDNLPIPVECLVLVMSFCDAKMLCIVSQTSRLLNRIANDDYVWRYVNSSTSTEQL